MKLLQRLLSRTARNRSMRGLSTAELVGIIVIVGILGALGGTYINGLVSTAKTNSGLQNAQSLNTVLSSALAGGATLDTTGAGTTAADAAAGIIDVTSAANCISGLELGITVTIGTNPPVTYKMSPNVGTPASYTLAGAGAGATPTNLTFGFTPGAAP
jgi:hypothetical protein